MKRILLSICFLAIGLWASAGDMSNSIELTQLYIIGDATPYSWDLGKTPDMKKIDEGVFRWSGKLQAGKEFKFLNTREFHKHLVATSAGQKVSVGHTYDLNLEIDRGLDGSRDFKFVPSATGDYTIYVDLRSMKMAVYQKEVTVDLPSRLYVSGSALGNKVIELPLYGDVEFKALLNLQKGTLRLQDTPTITSKTQFYLPRFEGVDISFGHDYSESLQVSNNANAEGWSVTVPGKYCFYAIKDSHHAFAKAFKARKTLYIVGGCCPHSWDYWTDVASIQFVPNPSNPEELVWEGFLKPTWDEHREEPNKFKILTAQDWYSETFHPYVADAPLLGTSYFRSSGGGDVKWTISEAAYYRITVNTATETIKGEKIDKVSAKFNGTETTGVKEVETQQDIRITHQNGNIYLVSSQIPVNATVYTMGGSIVASRPSIQEGLLASNLTKGIYFVKTVGNNSQCSKKIMVE